MTYLAETKHRQGWWVTKHEDADEAWEAIRLRALGMEGTVNRVEAWDVREYVDPGPPTPPEITFDEFWPEPSKGAKP